MVIYSEWAMRRECWVRESREVLVSSLRWRLGATMQDGFRIEGYLGEWNWQVLWPWDLGEHRTNYNDENCSPRAGVSGWWALASSSSL